MLLGFQFAMDSEAQTMNQRREESPGRGQELGLPAAMDREWHQESGLFAACWVSTQVRNHNLLWRDGEHFKDPFSSQSYIETRPP